MELSFGFGIGLEANYFLHKNTACYEMFQRFQKNSIK